MAISSITTDYSTRTKDILIFLGANPAKSDKQPVTAAFGNISAYCAGVQKLIQRYFISFFTTIGSQENFTDFGSNFLQRIISSRRNITKTEILHIFNFANAKVLGDFRTYQSNNPNLPLDEQIGRAELTDAIANGDTLSLTIKIITLAGDTITFVLPLPNTL